MQEMQGVKNFQANEPVVIIGFGQMGQVNAPLSNWRSIFLNEEVNLNK